MKKTKKITLALALGMLPLLHAHAAGVVQVSPNLFVPSYTNQEMVSAGCDSNNWNTLVNNYVAKRTNERVVEKAQTDQYIANAPFSQGSAGSNNACFQAAVSTVNGVITQVNSIKNLLSGNGSLTAMAANLANQYGTAACQQAVYMVGSKANQMTGAVSGGIYQGINTATGGLQGAINGVGINGVNAGSVINSGYNTNNTNTANNIPYVSTGSVSNAINSATGTSLFNKMNPFRSSDAQQVPESLK